MSYIGSNISSPLLKKEKIINSYNFNQSKSIESSSKQPVNRPFNNKSETDTPLSSISNNNFQAQNGLLYKDIFNKKNKNIVSSQDFNMNNLKNKLNSLRQTNRNLNNEYQIISKKSRLLINDINKNNALYSKIQKGYENEMNKNNELKEKCHSLLQNYKNEIKTNKKDENIEQNDIDKLKNEQKILQMRMKTKEDIINYLKYTLQIIQSEIEEGKKGKIYNNNKDNKKNSTTKIKNLLNNFNNKIEENKKNINNLDVKKEYLNKNNNNRYYNHKNIINNIISEYNNKNKIKDEIKKDLFNQKIDSFNKKNNEKNNKIEEKQLNKLKEIIKHNQETEQSFGFPDLSLSKSNKNNSNLGTTQKNRKKNFLQNEFDIIQYHKKNQSYELGNNDIQLISNRLETINQDFINKTIPNTSEDKMQIKENLSRKLNKKEKENSFLFSITKEGKLLEYNIIRKVYYFIDTSKITEWNNFISDYLRNYEGSLFLNTLQGFFALSGDSFSNLYYFSKKYNSISKLKSFKYNHKYGGLILSPDNISLLLIGGETEKNEIMNFESGIINDLPQLSSKRVNSALTFMGKFLFVFFGKNNSTIEFLNIEKKDKWELIDYNINTNQKINLEGHTAIAVNRNEILILGGKNNTKLMIFNFKNKNINLTDINMPFIEKIDEYIFDKDKYFNAYIRNNSLEVNYSNSEPLNQLIGMDSIGNIHSFTNDFNYSVILFENEFIKTN